jgi:hypothetical protein
MTYPAFEAREITGTVLLRDPALMARWKDAATRDEIVAVSINGVNYSVVKNADLVQAINLRYGSGLSRFEYDDSAKTVSRAI